MALKKLASPQGIAIDAQNHINVVDADNSRILKLDGDGKLLAVVGTPDSGEGKLNTPVGRRLRVRLQRRNIVFGK